MSLIKRFQSVRSPALIWRKNGDLTDRLLSHVVGKTFPTIELGNSPAKPTGSNIATAERLLRAYNTSMNEAACERHMLEKSPENIWDKLADDGLKDLLKTVNEDNAKSLADFLQDFGSNYIWFGGLSTAVDGYNRNREPQQVALTYWDGLVRLAEYLGLRRVENPEYGPWGEALYENPETLCQEISNKLGIDIFPPLGIIHTDGITVSDKLLHYRHVNSLYASIRVKELTHLCSEAASPVLEVGGGIGLAAMYASRLGVLDYTILDLPVVNLLAANYLVSAVGANKVTLNGEEHKRHSIKILPFWRIEDWPENSFSVCLNQDSLNELDEEKREFYRDRISGIVTNYFLSINHECFFPRTVAGLLSHDEAYKLISRSPYWIRSGYVEDLYSLESRI